MDMGCHQVWILIIYDKFKTVRNDVGNISIALTCFLIL